MHYRLPRPAPMAACITLVLLALGATAWARPGVLGTIERSVARLGRTPMADRQVTLVERPGFSLWVRPAARVIGVSHGLLSQKGFFLGRDGKLSGADRTRLGQLLLRHAPGTSPRIVHGTLAQKIREFRAHQRTLRQQDPVIKGLLRQAAGLKGQDTVLWRGSRGSLVYRPSANVLVGSSSSGLQGFFLSRGTTGSLNVQSSYQEALRQFLHANR